jgi:predicted Zn-dependent peptidase
MRRPTEFRAAAAAAALSLAMIAAPAWCAFGRESATHEVTVFRLPNNLTVVLAKRPGMTLAAVNLTVRAGKLDDPPEMSGMAHLLEHVMLTGTARWGSRNPRAEQRALAALDKAYTALNRGERDPASAPALLERLRRSFRQAQVKASRWAEPGEVYTQVLEGRGAVGVNAVTSAETTQYFARLPAGEVGFWLELEADRLRNPLFRHFYQERQIVDQEQFNLTGGQTTLVDLFLESLSQGQLNAPVLNSPRGLANIDRAAARQFYRNFYRPENITIAIVGDVNPEEIRRVCERHWGGWTASPVAAVGAVTDKESREERPAHVVTFGGSAPAIFAGFRLPALWHTDAPAVEVIAELLNSEHLSPLRDRLVDKGRLALAAGAVSPFPGEKFQPNFIVYIYGSPRATTEQLARAATALLEQLPQTSDEDIRGAIYLAELRLTRKLEDPAAFASALAHHQAVYGDWRVLFKRLEAIKGLTPASVRQAMVRRLNLRDARFTQWGASATK